MWDHSLEGKLVPLNIDKRERERLGLFKSEEINLKPLQVILSGPNRLGTEEAIIVMIDFMEKHGGMGIGTEEASSATIPSSNY
ncbi:hypothetical protein L195_g016163 [Trifolium pratense]|uniref:Uncharacterized protein n=1 Tax=Trifolium pratense TaxID=57577 RepID=A0A2K3MQD6_TRIPR|nr:hypothetical protein L195_g016163 [Trifolium pratense]